jgi:hypothetical protein
MRALFLSLPSPRFLCSRKIPIASWKKIGLAALKFVQAYQQGSDIIPRYGQGAAWAILLASRHRSGKHKAQGSMGSGSV